MSDQRVVARVVTVDVLNIHDVFEGSIASSDKTHYQLTEADARLVLDIIDRAFPTETKETQ